MSYRPTSLRRAARTCVALASAGSFVLAGASAATATPIDLPFSGSSELGSSAPAAVVAPRLASVDNFRDVAGREAGYIGTGGLHVRQGVFYRANAITPSAEDLATLESLHLTAVYDLRTEAEIAANPNTLPSGVRYEKIQVLAADPSGDVASIATKEQALAYVQSGYRSTVSDSVSRVGFGELLTQLADTPGAQIFHCTAGKDRTGWASALLLSIAGVSRETVMEDYLLTNEYSAASIDAKVARIAAAKGQEYAEVYRLLLGVDASYLQAAFDELDNNYESFDSYLVDGLGLDVETIIKLKLKLLV
ncbi:protein-tyrosine-phosphatase [Rhodococcus sp. AD45-ID]|uniref:tyrosine-protein phosphatase n=1 Tax=unclassified Rhodococcus (in: high G+C Gram-positive bacteria) TaxID=192944 RepID=UPI0005D3B7E0|nr:MULTISPECIES: tyrosine-protein phosphatase [unclassified Rhodococcus (in: high G+C Gram-positive bacteria)]KJF22463.1 Tyrosine-protein phosphatase precursor [Rhodococcus sp. AD45]PSR40085.1 protein-tyrosine-phosphatase [Rhodococcus sp. AD45-ID]